ncbi:hypothetical protein ACM26V_23025 [Salipaludibacillus sp. HK11]|uniref:hypothetical protein n=1 Tax=Salipaludibacillus sp. HK11 TaxID=3394320 RepID=UPI0039FC9CF9
MDTSTITLTVSFMSLTISGILAIITIQYNKVTIRNEARVEHNKLMLEIDKMYIDDPDLWSIYDDHPISDYIEKTPLKRGKKEALIYYYINFFDIIFDFYHKKIYKNKNDKEDWESWAEFIYHFFNRCSLAREMFRKSATWYDKAFSVFLLKVIDEIEAKEEKKTNDVRVN